MASIKNLKKEFKYVLGDLIDAILIWEITTENENQESISIKNEIFEKYERYLSKVNNRSIEQRGLHIKSLKNEFASDVHYLVEKINNLS